MRVPGKRIEVKFGGSKLSDHGLTISILPVFTRQPHGAGVALHHPC